MKKLVPLSFLCLIFLSASCSKDPPVEEKEETTRDLIIGKWDFTKIYYHDGVNSQSDCDYTASFEFFSNGTLIKKQCNYSYESEGDYSVTGNRLELRHQNPFFGGMQTMKAEILRINSEEMILNVAQGYIDNGPVTIYLEKAN